MPRFRNGQFRELQFVGSRPGLNQNTRFVSGVMGLVPNLRTVLLVEHDKPYVLNFSELDIQ
jgi:hypothetical protein